MREYEEVGKFKTFPDRANEAYRIYASIYLDSVDDNMSHFSWRDIDIEPIQGIVREGNEHFEDEVFEAYIAEALSIAATVIKTGGGTFEDVCRKYPLLKEKADELKEALKEKQETVDCEAYECFAI